MELLPGDAIETSHRRPASVETSLGCTIWMERGCALSLDARSDGGARVTFSSGTAFFAVLPRTSPFVVSTPEAEVRVTGTSFLVDREDKRSSVAVLEGTVRLQNEKGGVLLQAGQRSTARAGEKPGPAVRVDVAALAAWRLRPELSGADGRDPYSEHESGANRKLPGLVLAAPFYEGEAVSGRFARMLAERMDVGLVIGHRFRDLATKTWINVDRGMEAEVRADGSLGTESFTDRARKATADYLDHARLAAGVAPRAPVPMLVQFRNHYLTQSGRELEVCELALAGWDRRTVAGLKALYGQLLDKYKPDYRMEMRFQGVDDTYEAQGAKRAFIETEADPRLEGYMAPRNSRSAAAFFFNPRFGTQPQDLDVYSRILADLLEYLYLRRR